MQVAIESGTYRVWRTTGGYIVIFLLEDNTFRFTDDYKVHKHKQAAYRKAARLNKEKEQMSKQVVEWITREGRFITEQETVYLENGELTHSRGAVQKFDEAGKMALLEKQIAGETPTEPYEREYEDPHMIRRTSSCIEERVKNR